MIEVDLPDLKALLLNNSKGAPLSFLRLSSYSVDTIIWHRVHLVRCILDHVNFSGIEAEGVHFEECVLNDCNFCGADMVDATFVNCAIIKCNLFKASFCCGVFNTTSVVDCDARWTNFIRADLSSAVFKGTLINGYTDFSLAEMPEERFFEVRYRA